MQFALPLTLGKFYYVYMAFVASAIVLSSFRQNEYDAECSRPDKFAFQRNHLRNFHFFLFRQRETAVASAAAITTLHIFYFQPIWVATLLY